MNQKQQRPPTIFSVCADQDTAWLGQWEAHLYPLQRAGFLSILSQRYIPAGYDREECLYDCLDNADLIIPLLSVDFFMSDECELLMRKAFARHQQGTA
jgi:hypothetical protein